MFFHKWLRRPKVPVSRYHDVIERYKTIDAQQFSGVYSSDKSILQILVISDNLEEYHHLLERILLWLDGAGMVPMYSIPEKEKIRSLRQFFLDKESRFLNLEDIVPAFRDRAIDLLQTVEAKEANTQEDFTLTYNLRVIQPVIQNLVKLPDLFTDLLS